MTAFLDSNIILDILLQNKVFYEESRSLLVLGDGHGIDYFVSATSITDIYYIVHKYEKDDLKVRAHIANLLEVVSVAGIDESCVRNALNSSWKDFEDAVQNEAAVQINADYLVTRNTKDFTMTFVPVMTPADFIQLFDASSL